MTKNSIKCILGKIWSVFHGNVRNWARFGFYEFDTSQKKVSNSLFQNIPIKARALNIKTNYIAFLKVQYSAIKIMVYMSSYFLISHFHEIGNVDIRVLHKMRVINPMLTWDIIPFFIRPDVLKCRECIPQCWHCNEIPMSNLIL